MVSLANLTSSALGLAANLRGWRTRRKLLIIESDDWGAIRMPSRDAWERLLAAGIRVDRSRYDSLDCLESKADFQALMNVIDAHRDVHGRPAIFTLNTVMGNPDFAAIEQDNFQRFHHQNLFDSYEEYYGENLRNAWASAMSKDLIRPQFHAREHLNVPLWMNSLQRGHPETKLAFDNCFYGLKTDTGSPNQCNYLSAYWPDSQQHLMEIQKIVANGVEIFQETFGYRSETFVACNYVWPEKLERHLLELGIYAIQTQRGQLTPDPRMGGRAKVRRHYVGKTGAYGQVFSVRNVLLEPFLDDSEEWPKRALGQVRQAFRLGKPAVVSSHRINYVSGLSTKHRDRSLRFLSAFLNEVAREWPDVEFLSSCDLARLLQRSYSK